jgi:dihydroorotase
VQPAAATAADVEALREALADGTIDAVATDHAPHSPVEKDVEFEEAAFGMIGLETALPLVLDLVRAGMLTPAALVTRMSVAPAAAFGLPGGTLADGAAADVTVIDPEASWTCRRGALRSRSRNTPFSRQDLAGRTALTVVGGTIAYSGERLT